MKDALMTLLKDEVDEQVTQAENKKEQETTVIHLKDIMESFGVTAEKAMDSLKIPIGQRPIYIGLINRK